MYTRLITAALVPSLALLGGCVTTAEDDVDPITPRLIDSFAPQQSGVDATSPADPSGLSDID
ncbi:MAG: hypothetical protein ACYTF0_06675, partial [Planctomycetota bacterium]